MAPLDDKPPQCKTIATPEAGKALAESTTKTEMDRKRKEAARFNTGQKLVDGINNIKAVATPVSDGVKIIQNAMQLPSEEAVWLMRVMNRCNEWEMFNSMSPKNRETYVSQVLKDRIDQFAEPVVPAYRSQEAVGQGGRVCTATVGPPPPTSGFQSLMKMQAGSTNTGLGLQVSHCEAMGQN